ncbi:MAG: serine hydrolase [Bacteroidia bacterium]|nr:serine hydrolase [Bacteroidia bacterium]
MSAISLMVSHANAQNSVINWNKNYPWVDSVMSKLTLDEKIAQLMTIAVWTQRDSTYIKEVEKLIIDQKIGGLMFMKGTPHKEATLTNFFQSKSKVPLLVSIDGEWGLSMRLDSTPVFPRQMVLGGANNLELTRQIGNEIAKQCKRLGIHLNFAPDIDVNSNPANPVINDRSFGENKYIVARHGVAFAKGMQEQHVMACAKHFPGHGDTESDSHFALPVINATSKRLDSLELYPFKELIKNDVGAIMVAHLYVPSIDTTANRATSISPLAVKTFLKKELAFGGLVVTDGLNMKGVANYAAPGEVSAKALAAGNDLLLFVEDIPQSIFWIKEYIIKGLITEDDVNKACRKILIAKYWAGLNQYKPVELKNLYKDLNCCANDLLIKKVIKQGIVIAKNQDHVLPLDNASQYKIASIAVGNNQFTVFQQTLHNYLHANYFSIDKNESSQSFDSVFGLLQHYSLIIISLHNTSRFVSKKLGLTQMEIDFVNRLLTDRKCILVNLGNPYILQHFSTARNVILAYEDLPVYNNLAAQALMGAYTTTGRMPVSVTSAFPLGSGIENETLNRFEYNMPEETGIDPVALSYIDTIIKEAIDKVALPGCQIVVAKAGKVIYQKSFGKLSSDTNAIAVQNYHLYDLASLTKMLATTLALMKLVEENKIDLNDKLSLYLPLLKGSNKEKITIKEVMLHQAGLIPFIPFYKKTLTNGYPDTLIYHKTEDLVYSVKVADSLYINDKYEQEIWNTIIQSELKAKGEYVYSDLGFIMLRKVVENVSNQNFENYLNQYFYRPLNLANTVFNPLNKGIHKELIAATENDLLFRKQVLQGYVHDPGAAMLGGVSGHAGLFANANDVAIMMQMLLNGGTYGNVRVLKASTVELFTKRQNKLSRRGLGFDKPETDPLKPSPTGKNCSPLTFGHTGFTGTCAWADPKYDLVYVFLSNRVNPIAENNKLAQMNIRTRIQDHIYEVMKKAKAN